MKKTSANSNVSLVRKAIGSIFSNSSHREGKSEIEFQSNGVLTLGVEIELQIIDKETMNLSPRAEELLKKSEHISKVKRELFLNMLEINTAKCNNVLEVESDLKETMLALKAVAEEMGVALCTTASHPFAKYNDSIISPTDRYQELIDRNQWLAKRTTIYGLHVHIGMESGDDCIRFNNFFMSFIPHLIALSASSPFWQGTDTGLSACRPTMYEAIPTAGQPYHVRSWKAFEEQYETLKKCGSIKIMKDLWWDMRPSPNYGTLEIRVCDGCATLHETLAIVAFIHTLAHWFNDNGSWIETVNYPPRWLSRENKWRAIRHGLEADLVINSDGKVKLLREDIEDWISKLKPYYDKLGYQEYLENLHGILKNGTSSDRQRKIFEKTDSLEKIVEFNINEYLEQIPRWWYIKGSD